jgi:TetR/AcrR family transcriptional repressor of mexJK operon
MAANAYAISASPTAKRRGRPSAEHAEAKNAVIRAAALEVFASKGFGGASIVEIAKLAGVTRRTLYARYRDKQALLLDAVQGVIDERLQHYDLGAMASAEGGASRDRGGHHRALAVGAAADAHHRRRRGQLLA